MHILLIGNLEEHMTVVAKALMEKGAKISHAENDLAGMSLLKGGLNTKCIFIHMSQDLLRLSTALTQLKQENIQIIVCGMKKEAPEKCVPTLGTYGLGHLHLPPDPACIASILSTLQTNKRPHVQAPKSAQAFDLADRLAPSRASILITGESGTGKEVMARYIHERSAHTAAPFVSVNCAAIPENLLESELFGHEKGAFTGALTRRIGKFEEAHTGTLLLDEISEMHPRLQAKLLRAIQEKEIDRIGGKAPVQVDIRIISTSNRDLQKAVANGDFREDLYFRLNVVNIHLPPLRERQEDILDLSQYFLEKFAKLNRIPLKPLSEVSRTLLLHHPWPGNVREIENTMHRAILLCNTEAIEPHHLLLDQTPKENASREERKLLVGRTLSDVEKELIFGTLEYYAHDYKQTAQALGLSEQELYLKMQQHNQDHPAFPQPKCVA